MQLEYCGSLPNLGEENDTTRLMDLSGPFTLTDYEETKTPLDSGHQSLDLKPSSTSEHLADIKKSIERVDTVLQAKKLSLNQSTSESKLKQLACKPSTLSNIYYSLSKAAKG